MQGFVLQPRDTEASLPLPSAGGRVSIPAGSGLSRSFPSPYGSAWSWEMTQKSLAGASWGCQSSHRPGGAGAGQERGGKGSKSGGGGE